MKLNLDLSMITLVFLIAAVVYLILSACRVDETPESAAGLEPNVFINYAYYEIIGATANDLRTQMDRFGPADEFRTQHDAHTEWYVDWSYPNSIINGSCATGPIQVTVTITYTFPKWNIPPDASQELVDKWLTYIRALQMHEDGHKKIGLDAGYEILRTLNELPAYPSCSQLEQAADTVGHNILDEFRQQEVVYDQVTTHGEAQGVRFP